LYSGWLRRRGESIEHGADRDVLAGLHVADAYEAAPQIVYEGAPVDELLQHLGRTEQVYFPVVDESHRLLGVITVVELGQLAKDTGLTPLLLAGDIARPSETVTPSDSLLEAIRKMGVRGAASLPVIDRRTERLMGIITRTHVLNVYERAISVSHAAEVAHGADARDAAPVSTER
jgi:CIC family chloride channel protein